jgi:hypothetical protein
MAQPAAEVSRLALQAKVVEQPQPVGQRAAELQALALSSGSLLPLLATLLSQPTFCFSFGFFILKIDA